VTNAFQVGQKVRRKAGKFGGRVVGTIVALSVDGLTRPVARVQWGKRQAWSLIANLVAGDTPQNPAKVVAREAARAEQDRVNAERHARLKFEVHVESVINGRTSTGTAGRYETRAEAEAQLQWLPLGQDRSIREVVRTRVWIEEK
jgi:hypothetical protein